MKLHKDKVKFLILRTLGNFFLLFSLYGMAMTFGPALYLEVNYRITKARNVKYAVVYSVIAKNKESGFGAIPEPTFTPNTAPTFFGKLTGGNKVETLSPVSSKFGIVIPKIGANAQIMPNVDAGKPEIYLPALQKGVAHALGTVFPGVAGNIYLFAHSTDAFWNVGRYNAIFYLLKELEKGDEIDIFYLGVRHLYRVTDKKTVDPSEVHYLTDSIPNEQLTLQTCWPPGTTLKRMLIIAKPESEI
jgi:LPXTG-site transpeptidase (sortase) family protein